VHWHGAAEGGEFTHVAIVPSATKGTADWMQPVTDDEYAGAGSGTPHEPNEARN